ncbi:MAG: hypothetical protein JST32_11410 [Bacteroidetes bacterium]|nr:hypothetical protein [Bacteroidota bacterium]
MSIQYLSDKEGQIVAVQVPIDEWRVIRSKHPDIELDIPIPEWQKKLLDERLSAIEKNGDSILPIDGLIEELNKD